MSRDTEQPALRVTSLRFGYPGGSELLRGLSLEAHAGGVHAVLGPSGCGKSTLLRLIAGLEHPSGGSIELAGRTVASESRSVPPHRRGVGFVFQDLGLFPNRSALGNVMFGMRGSRRDVRARACALLELVGIRDEAERAPGELSGGQRRRVALARALGPEPNVMLLDEAFDGLDAELRQGVRGDVLRILRERGIATVMVTHDEHEAECVSDRMTRLARVS